MFITSVGSVGGGGGGLSLVVECLYVGFRFDVHYIRGDGGGEGRHMA